jgi:hypothetical protein
MFSLVSTSRVSLLNRLSAALAVEAEDLEAHVRHRVAPAGRRVAFAVSEVLAGTYSKGSTAARYAAGYGSREGRPRPQRPPPRRADPHEGLTPRTRPGRQRAIAGSCRPARRLPATAPGGRPCCVGLPGCVMARQIPGPEIRGSAPLGQEAWSQPIEQPFPQGERPTVNNPARAGTEPASKAGSHAIKATTTVPTDPAATTSARGDESGS